MCSRSSLHFTQTRSAPRQRSSQRVRGDDICAGRAKITSETVFVTATVRMPAARRLQFPRSVFDRQTFARLKRQLTIRATLFVSSSKPRR